MNTSIIRNTIGRLLQLLALLLIGPLLVSILYREELRYQLSFIIPIVLSFSAGRYITTSKYNDFLGAQEALVITALVWLVYSLFGSLPYLISGTLPSFVDSFFETMSGFTTTGSTVIPNVEVISKSILFWRSFTLFIGGLGVVVFALAILPASGSNMTQVMKVEATGPTFGKLASKISDTAKILYRIYLVMTLFFIVILALGPMDLFDSILHIFGAAGTGGFAIKNASMFFYDDVYSEVVVGIAMLLFGINFHLYYLIMLGRAKDIFKSEELKAYFVILISSIILIMINIASQYESIMTLFRDVSFTVTSFITTTTYITVDYDMWPLFSHIILMGLMFVGGMAGSTAGGVKVSRILILIKTARAEIKYAKNPSRVQAISYEGQILDKKTLRSVLNFFALYIFVFGISLLLISLDSPNFLSAFSTILATINNVGPGINAVGATQNYSWFSDFSKVLLSFIMYIGRLEIIPVLVLFNPFNWLKRGSLRRQSRRDL